MQDELVALRNYIANLLIKNRIRSFNDSIEVFILFIKKSDNILQLYVDYRELNKIIIKNKYSLSFFSKTLKRFIKVRKFIKIIIRNYTELVRSDA